jgi:hypothetical protein
MRVHKLSIVGSSNTTGVSNTEATKIDGAEQSASLFDPAFHYGIYHQRKHVYTMPTGTTVPFST